jgi:hypothetical protein
MKTIELIGLFNEFNEGALAILSCKHLKDIEVTRYMKLYHEWCGHVASNTKKDIEQALALRD